MYGLPGGKYITIISGRKKIVLNISTILYVLMIGKTAEIHVLGDRIYGTRMTLGELEKKLGEQFIKVHRGCIVSAMAIHDITDSINLSNGEHLEYTVRKKKIIIDQLYKKQQSIIRSITKEGIPTTTEEYRRYYRSFDSVPYAVDWIFRYGNPALAKLEKLPLTQLIGSSFGSLFSNMDSKWLRSYERATLYGETLEIIDYSPEIDTYLKVICFPTFRGHCGCILFNISEIQFTKNSSDAEKALLFYFGKLPKDTV